MRAAFGFGFGLPLGDSGDASAIDWNFAGGVMPSALTFSRASLATMYDAAGTLVTASSGSPRMTYDPVTHSALGLLVEEQRTNLLLNSLLDGTNLSTQSVTVAATQYTLSFYGTGQIVLSGSATATVVGTGAFPTQKTYTFTPSAGSLTLTVTGTVQFAQLEAGAFATSYIPTAGASATRAADVVTCTGSAFSQWFNASEGTLVVEFVCPSVSSTTYQRAFSMRDNAETKRLEAYIDVSGALTAYLVGSAGDLKVLVGSVTPRAIYKAAIAADASTASAVANGGAVSSLAAAGVLSAMQKLTLGNSGDVSMAGALNSSIKRVRYWRKRLTNAQLQALTA